MKARASFKASCHCGAVSVLLAQQPDYMNDCNCTLCRNAGAVWGYFNPAQVQVSGQTRQYERADYDVPAVSLHFCETCGATTHWTMTDAFVERHGFADRMGVNMHLFDAPAKTGVELRFPDGIAWDGAGETVYRKAPIVL